MKIERLRVFQSVKIGNKEKTFLVASEFEMELRDTLVFIKSKVDNSQVVTPLTNVPWFVPMAETSPTKKATRGQNKSKTNTGRDSKKATTKA